MSVKTEVEATPAILEAASQWWPQFMAMPVPTRTQATSIAKPIIAETRPIASTGRSGVQWVSLGVAASTTAGLAYALYRRANEHYTHLTVTENVSLAPETTGEFVEVAMPLEGEVRLDCRTLSHCKFQLKLNSSLKAEHGRVKDESTAGRSSGRNIKMSNVNMSELCDSWLSEYTGHLHFSPSCSTDNAVLMTYSSTTHESFQPAVAVRDCSVEPASSALAHRLAFDLHVYSSVMDLAVTMILPKGSRILKVSTGGKGSCAAANPLAPHEIIWNVGTFTRETDSNGKSPRKAVLKKQGHTNQEGLVGFDTIPDLGSISSKLAKNRNPPATIEDEAADLTRTVNSNSVMGPTPIELLAQEQMMALSERLSEVVSFEVIYSIDIREAERELNRGRSASQATAAFVANNRRERRQMERDRKKRAKKEQKEFRTNAAVTELPSEDDEDDENRLRPTTDTLDASHISFNPSEHTPGVFLSYSTQATTSGLSVRKLQTNSETRNYNLFEDLLGPSPSLEEGAPAVVHTRKQRAARFAINSMANAVIGSRNQLRGFWRRIYSTVTRRPLPLTAEEQEEASAMAADVQSLYSPNSNVRVPQSIVKQMRKDKPAVNNSLREDPFGRNPFSPHQPNDNDEFVHVSHNDVQATPSVAFNLPENVEEDRLAPPPKPKPKDTFLDRLIKERAITAPKLHKRVRYVTRFMQQVRVAPQF
eukprot:GILI01012710.1.p1 GENE.GILI01012710.1~~GILI01012710.1.p1  ORF type:complete len:719 (+),score=99.40 GILI01012710.1:43-2157(+)